MSDLPKWFNKDREKINARSRKQERERAKQIGGRTQPGSGSSWRAPEDIVAPEHLEQIKFSDSKGFRITVDEWKRLRGNANRLGKSPRLVIDFPAAHIRLVVTEESIEQGKSLNP